VLCDRCELRDATAGINTVAVSSDGTESRRAEHLCGSCFAAEIGAQGARHHAIEQQVRAGLADGSVFDHIRADLAPVVQNGDPEQLAQAAEYLDLLIGGLDVAVPADLREFADRHRRPTA
jgi:hypothetical protein